MKVSRVAVTLIHSLAQQPPSSAVQSTPMSSENRLCGCPKALSDRGSGLDRHVAQCSTSSADGALGIPEKTGPLWPLVESTLTVMVVSWSDGHAACDGRVSGKGGSGHWDLTAHPRSRAPVGTRLALAGTDNTLVRIRDRHPVWADEF